jgi:hypothetical protein
MGFIPLPIPLLRLALWRQSWWLDLIWPTGDICFCFLLVFN